jgi:lipopolysaccharide biosynthesis glycosyltransferase
LRQEAKDSVTGLIDLGTGALRLLPFLAKVARPCEGATRWLLAGHQPSTPLRRRILSWPLTAWVMSLVLGALLAVRDLEAAEGLLASVPEPWPRGDDPRWRLRALQVWCLSGRLDRAEQLVASWGGFGEVPQVASATAAGLLAALGRWDDVIAFLADRVDRGMAVRGYLFYESVAGAARHTGRYDEILRLLPGPLHRAEAISARDALATEAELLFLLGRRAEPPPWRVRDRLHTDRLRALEAAVSGTDRPDGPRPATVATEVDGALVWCSDRQYLLGTCVSMWSLLRHNRGLTPSAGIEVVVSPDVVALAGQVFARLADAAGVAITVRDASSVIPALGELRAEYGLFTPGHVLSAAAYYRLFAVRTLLAGAPGARIVYLDSDTCIGPGAHGFFDLDLGAHPLAARSERQPGTVDDPLLAAVDEAAHRHGLEPGSYFNSGVLVFDGSHPGLAPALDRAIHLALEEPERLMFHDQCALNLAFAGQVVPLEETYNRFIRPQNGTAWGSSVVTHYLERPKPWDPLYPTGNCAQWFDELAAVSPILGPDHMSTLLGSQFPDQSDFSPLPAPSVDCSFPASVASPLGRGATGKVGQ